MKEKRCDKCPMDEVCAERDAYKEELEIIGEAKMRSDDLYRLLKRYRSEVKWERENNNDI